MRLVKGKEMKEIDRLSIEKYGKSSLELMETAGTSVYEEIMNQFHDDSTKITVICGKGNNGGDGYVIARKLIEKNTYTYVYSTTDPNLLEGDVRYNYERLIDLGVEVKDLYQESFIKDIVESEIIVDAILGTGISRDVDADLEKIIHAVNKAGKKVFSVDIPSGLGSDDGKVYGAAIKAFKTITFGLPKIGLILYPGADYVGQIVIKDIGLKKKAMDEMHIRTFLINHAQVQKSIPKRMKNTHKGTYGKVLIVAGSRGMAGAAVLSAKAALRSGAGLVTIGVGESINDILQVSVPEAMTLPFKEIEEKINDYSSIAIGPGLGKNQGLLYWIDNIVGKYDGPIILDADALNIIGKNAEAIFSKNNKIVITPHPGEMAKLTGLSIKEINENIIETGRFYSQKWRITVIIKGARSVIAFPDGTVYINITGNPGMATGGSGDVLTGILVSLCGQIQEMDKAVISGVYLHGRSGDIMAEKVGEYGLIAGDIACGIAFALKELHDI
ncbi:MAG: NAD(P)H-hydrate dehydratase [Peptostreptococcales bacterium]